MEAEEFHIRGGKRGLNRVRANVPRSIGQCYFGCTADTAVGGHGSIEVTREVLKPPEGGIKLNF